MGSAPNTAQVLQLCTILAMSVSSLGHHTSWCAKLFIQLDFYHASQPAIFLLDAHYEIFASFGWWWKEEKGDENSITATANSNTTGSRISRWLRDKQLVLETAQQYAKACTSFLKACPTMPCIHLIFSIPPSGPLSSAHALV